MSKTNSRRKTPSKNKKQNKAVIKLVAIILLIVILVLLLISLYSSEGSLLGSSEPTDPYAFNITSDDLAAISITNATEINSYGENLNIELSDGNYEETYTLVSTATKEDAEAFKMSENIDIGIGTNEMPTGSYVLRLSDGTYLGYDGDLSIEFNTITRDGLSNPISISVNNGLINIVKDEATADNDELDILVDAGHGGSDTGASSYDGSVYESEVNLVVANLVANKLEAMGYNVGVTRTDDTQPGECTDNINAYCEGGRVTQAYDQNAKLVVSIHHNTGGGQGFEVFSSTYASHTLASMIAENLLEISSPSSRLDGYITDGVYTQTFDDDDGTLQDYMYMIREVGGLATKSSTEENAPQNQDVQGSDSVLIELGYLDNYTDLLHVTDSDVQEAEATAIADAVNDYINSTESNIITSEQLASEAEASKEVSEDELQEF